MDGPDDESIYSLNLLLTPSVDPPSNRIQLDIFSLYPVLGSLEPGQLCEQLAVALKTTNRPVHLKTGERVTLAISSALFVTCWSTPRHFQTNGCEFGIFTFRIFEGEWKVWTVLRFYKLAQVGKSGGLIRPQNFLAHTHSFWQNLDNLYYEPCSLLPIETRHAVCGVKIDFFLSLGSLPSDVWRKETLSGRYWDQSRNSGTILFSQLQRRPHLTVRSS